MRFLKGKIWVIVIGIIILVAGYFLIVKPPKHNPHTQPTKSIDQKKDLPVTITTTGEVVPIKEVEIKSRASGKIISFKKEEGDKVKANEVFVELDPEDELLNYRRQWSNYLSILYQGILTNLTTKFEIERAKLEYNRATEEYIINKNKYERHKALPEDATTVEQIEEIKLRMIKAEERKEELKARIKYLEEKVKHEDRLSMAEVMKAITALSEAKRRLDDTKLSSPIDGIILKKYVEEGQIISSGITAIGGGTPIAIVADTSKMKVIANVDESDLGKIFIGQKCLISTDAYPDKKFPGEIKLISPKGEEEKGIIVFKVEIMVYPDEPDILKAGMTANVEIMLSEPGRTKNK